MVSKLKYLSIIDEHSYERSMQTHAEYIYRFKYLVNNTKEKMFKSIVSPITLKKPFKRERKL